MTVPFGPFRFVVSISRRCREHLVVARALGATDAELVRLACSQTGQADRIRWQAEQALYGSRLV